MNRAPKIGERLGSRQGELRTQAKELSALVELNGFSPQQVTRLSENKSLVVAKVEEQAAAANAQAVIRGAIGKANAEHGINEVLAQIEANKKVIACLDDMISRWTKKSLN